METKIKAGELRHKRFISILQLAIGLLSAIILSLVGYYFGYVPNNEDPTFKEKIPIIIEIIFFIEIIVFLYLNSKLTAIEEKMGWNVESEGSELKEVELEILKIFLRNSKGLTGFQLDLKKLFPNLKIKKVDIMPTIDKLRRQGYISKNMFQNTYTITDLGINYIDIESKSLKRELVIEKNLRAINYRFKESEILPKITTHSLVKETDGEFTQIGKAIKIDAEFFDPSEPTLVGLDSDGFFIARGEIEYLTQSIIKDIKASDYKNKMKAKDFLDYLKRLLKTEANEENIVILTSNVVKNGIIERAKDYLVNWSNEKNMFVLELNKKEIPIYYVKDEIIGNRIIAYNKKEVLCKTKTQINPFNKKETQRLFLHYEEKEEKTRLEMKTLIKIILKNRENIKIFKNVF